MSQQMSPTVGTAKPLTQKQLRAIDLRCDGHSWEQVCKHLDVTLRTMQNWRKHPDWDAVLESRKQEWVKEYELRFTKMLPSVALKHQQLLNSQSEAIAMRAVDSAHANHARCVRDKEAADELAELKALCRTLMDRLEAQSIT